MIHSFLLIGQSNMAGRGDIAEAPEMNTSHIKLLRNGRWQGMFRPINADRSFSGFCLAESFAERYSQKYNVDVGLICCADGGTTLNQWQPGSLLFDHAVYQARLAQRTSTIAGVLWHQGESDCLDTLYPQYREKMERIIRCLRKELALEDVPFLLGGLGEYLLDCPRPDWQMHNSPVINDTLRSMASKEERIGFVSAAGLTPKADCLHFNTESLYQFGIRYFDEFIKLADPHKVFEEKPHPDNALRTELELL